MIPKIIHYCWFGGGPLPQEAKRCIESWKKFFPDYIIKHWDESNFDVTANSFVADAYKAKKYAFVSDYARFAILYEYGGLYFDTDVEIIQPMDDIVSQGAFMGCELSPTVHDNTILVAAGLGLGVEAGHPIYKELLDEYQQMAFADKFGKPTKTVVHVGTEVLKRHGLQNTDQIQQVEGIWIYPKPYFCPIDYDGHLHLSPCTRSIHYYAGTWRSPFYNKMRKWTLQLMGVKGKERIARLLHKLGKKY